MVNVQLKGWEQVRSALRLLPEKLQKEVDIEMRDEAYRIEAAAKRDAPADQGTIRQDILVKRYGLAKYSVVSGAMHAGYMEFGTKKKFRAPSDPFAQKAAQMLKGPGSSKGEFRENILRWTRRKGIRFQSAGSFKSGKRKGQNKTLTFEQTGYIIYHFIALNGISGKPYLFKQFNPQKRADFLARTERRVSDLLNHV